MIKYPFDSSFRHISTVACLVLTLLAGFLLGTGHWRKLALKKA